MPELYTRPVSALPSGTVLNRLLRCHVASKGDLYAAQLMAEGYRDTPQVRVAFDLMTKAATVPGSTTDTTWAKPLVESGVAAEAVALLRDVSIVAQVAGKARRVPFRMQVPLDETAAMIGNWIAEGGPTPVVQLVFDAVAPLAHTKLGAIVPLSRELVLSAVPTAEAVVRRAFVGTLAKTIDELFLDPTSAATLGHPASITNGAPMITSTGTTAAAITADLAAMVAAITTAGGGLTWIMKRKTAATIAGALGAAVSGLPGSLSSLPIVVSNNSPAQITLADMNAVIYADDGEFVTDQSREATLQLNSTPDAPATPATPLTSFFQDDLVGMKALRWINWLRVADGAVVYMPVTY